MATASVRYPGLVQLRPGPRFTAGGGTPSPAPTRAREGGRAPLSRWIFVYIPAFLFVAVVLYVVCELAMKHFALSNLQEQLLALPEMPGGGAVSSVPSAPAAIPAPSAAAGPVVGDIGGGGAAVGAPPSDISFAMRSVVMRPRGAW